MCTDAAWGDSSCLGDSANLSSSANDNWPSVSNTTNSNGPFLTSSAVSYESWVIPMLVLASVNVLVVLAFEVYVVCKASRNTPSRRHLFLGQMLLLGLLLGSLVGFAQAVAPSTGSEWACAAVRLGTGLSYCFIYSAVLVKLVFLVSLNTGVYLPATYQALLFLFCMLVQVAIALQWLATGGPLCSYTATDHMLSLLYVVFLILFCTSLAVKSRHFRDNYREAKYIGALMAVTVPIWIAWTFCALVLQEELHPACEGDLTI